MPYSRPDRITAKSYHTHPIRSHDLHKHLHLQTLPYFIDVTDILNDGNFALGQLQRTLAEIKTQDWSEYKTASAKVKQNEIIHKARSAMLTFLRKHIERSRDYLNRTRDQITGLSAPHIPKDANEAIAWTARMREIRDILRASEPAIRHAMIKRGGLQWIQAAFDAPDDLVDGKFLQKQREQYAFMIDPSLQLKEQDAYDEYQAVRKLCADISAVASHALIDNKFDPEASMPPTEFYEVFNPETVYEANLVKTRIENYQKKQDAEADRVKFELEAVQKKEVQTATGLSLEEARGGE